MTTAAPSAPAWSPRLLFRVVPLCLATVVEAGATSLVLEPGAGATNMVHTNAIDLNGSTLTVTVPANTATMTGPVSDSVGTGGLAKSGGGVLVLAASNTYNGVTSVSQGTLRVAHARALGAISNGTAVLPGASLDLNAASIGGETVTISGGGEGGHGALVNNSSSQAGGFRLLLAADASIGGSARLDTSFNGTVINGGTNTLTKVGTNQFVINVGSTSIGPVRIEQGSVVVVNTGTPLGDTTFGTRVARDASLQFFNSSASVMTNGENITLTDGAELAGTFATNPTVLHGTVTLEGGVSRMRVDARGAGRLVVAGEIRGGGNLEKTGAGTLELRGPNTFAGNIAVAAGTLALQAGGALRFAIRDNGTNNALSGTGTVFIDGRFVFDLAGASTRKGDRWHVVTGSMTNPYGPNFLVEGFNGSGGLWTNTTNGVTYVFAQSNSTLSVTAGHFETWAARWKGIYPDFTASAGHDDPDGDMMDNHAEFAFGGDPMAAGVAPFSTGWSGGGVTLSYIARKDPRDPVTYVVQTTTNLATGPWTNVTVNSLTAVAPPAPAMSAEHELRLFSAAPAGSAFYRIQAEIAAIPPAPAPPENLRALPDLISRALADGQREIVIPPGRYRVAPQSRQHLLLRGVRDAVLVAEGVEMICTETTRAITIEDCENLTIRGLTIDYDPLPYTQGRITSISEDTARLEVEILAGYEDPLPTTGSVEIFDPSTDSLRGRMTYHSAQCEPAGPGRAVLTKSRAEPQYATERLGDIAVIRVSRAPGGSIPHAVFATRSKGLVFEKVTLHASNSFGFLENDCEASRYLHCRVERRHPAADFHPRGHQRLRSLNADAFHSKNARVGPLYDGCTAFHMGDDAIAINGDFHFVTRVEGSVLRVLAKSSMSIQHGDEVQFFTADGRRPENRRAIAVAADGPITAEERAMLLTQNLNSDLRTGNLNSAFVVTLDAPAPAEPGTLLCNAKAIGNGFTIRNCRLGRNRSRGIIVKAGYGEITGNHIEGASMTGILVSPEYWWMEGGMADNLVIADNLVTGGSGMGIAVVSDGAEGTLSPAGVFRRITVRNNRVEGGASPGLLLTSIRGLTDEANSVSPDPDMSLYPWEIGAWGHDGLTPVIKVNIEPESVAP